MTDLEENGAQCSLDPEADIRFAHFLGNSDAEKFIKDNLDEGFRIHLHEIADKRLRVLNGLIKLKLVKAGWVGTKYEGTRHVGVNRVRIYMLSTAVNIVSVQTVRNDIISKIRSTEEGRNE
jgi:predicted DNA-binding transcriptional regulator